MQALHVVDGDQGLRDISGAVARVLLAQVVEAPVVRGQLNFFGTRLRMQALSQRQLAVRDEPDRGTSRVDGERPNVRVELQ